MFKKIKNLFSLANNHAISSDVERYLSESSSLVELESRQRLIDRGQAPFQIYSRMVARGWIR